MSALLHGIGSGLEELSSLVFFLAITLLSLLFLLTDGPTIRAWGERHMGVPLPGRPHRQRAARSNRCAATSSA